MAKSFFNTGLLGAAGSSGPVDDQFNRVSFLSHFEGSNNGVNNAFDDGSTSNHTITANGNVTQGSFGPFARPDGEWGWNFDGDGDYLTVADSTEFDFGTGNFTIEGWINPAVISSFQAIFSIGSPVQIYSYNNTIISYFNDEDNASTYTINGLTGPSSSVSTNTWTHFAVVRNGNTYTTYVNGVAGSSLTSSDTVASSSNAPAIGTYLPAPTTYEFNGHISNLRLVKGTAVYTSNFTPSTSKLTAITNTKLLTCQSNRFIDNSASGHAITPTGTPAVTAFGPFLTDAVYDAAVNGASASFDIAATTNLTAADSADWDFGSDNYTVELWVYPRTTGTIQGMFNHWGDFSGNNIAWTLEYHSNGDLLYYFKTNNGITTLTATDGATYANQWMHVAAVRNSNVHTLYLDGVSKASATDSGTMNNCTDVLRVGAYHATYGFDGYICDARIVKGTAVYTGNFTPPTAPLTAITNTKLLLNMADAQAIDSAAQNNLTLYGNANTSTDQAKFGTASLHLDGTGDYAEVASSIGAWGTGNFTVEGWYYLTAQAQYDNLFDFRTSSNSSQLDIYFDDDPLRLHVFFGGADRINANAATPTNEWVHIAVVRNGSTTTLYQNGTSLGTSTTVTTFAEDGLRIGNRYDGDYYMQGYVDEFRISHMARYTSNFTAPTKAFADKGQDA